MSQSFWHRFGLIVIGAALLLWAPAVNRFPFIYTDTGTYIFSSVRFDVPQDRPIGYSVWLRFADVASPLHRNNVIASASMRERLRNSFANSLWSVVLWQAFGTSYLLVTLAEIVLARARRRFVWIPAILILTAFTTAVSVYVGAVMPDILTGWIFLAGAIFLLARERVDRWLAAALFATSIFVHNSHLALVVVMVSLAAVPLLFSQTWRARFRARFKTLAFLVAGSVAGMLLVNVILGAGFVIARGTDTFFLNRFSEAGILPKTLALNCAKQTWTLCAYQNAIAAHQGEMSWYMYGAGNPSDRVGWQNAPAEQRAVVVATFECCLDKIIATSIAESWKQFWTMRIQPQYVYLDDHWNAVIAIKNVYPGEYAAFEASVQQARVPIVTHVLPFDEQDSQFFFLALAIALLILCIVQRDKTGALLLLAALSFLVVNAAITGSFGHAEVRYQGRVFWILPFVISVVGASLLTRWLASRTRSIINF